MIAVLRSQYVVKRAPGARSSGYGAAGAVQIPGETASRYAERIPQLKGQRPAGKGGRPGPAALRIAAKTGTVSSAREVLHQDWKAYRRARRSAAPAGRRSKVGSRPPRHILSSALGNPVLAVFLAAVLLSLLLVPAFAMVGTPLPKISLPAGAALEQALYRMIIPEEPPEKTGELSVRTGDIDDITVRSYSVKSGDSISQIAQKLGLRLDTIISFNGIRDARSLRTGTVLRYPDADGISYRVRRGDTLDAIAASFSTPLEGILDKNGLDSSVISVGQELFIPGAHLSQNEIARVLGNLFLYPVRGRISSYFGERKDPFTGVKRFHNGIDIVNSIDTPILAAMAGRVESVGYNNNYGRFVIIKHVGTGYQTMYAHLDKTLVSRGQNVRQGQQIGELGNTGYSTGAHLHFSVFKNNEPVDPLRFLK